MPLPRNLPSELHNERSKDNQLVFAKRYCMDKKLGAGNFGTAFLIFDKNVEPPADNRKVLKQICVGTLEPGETVDAMREAKLLSQLKHKYIVQFFDSFLDGQFFCIVTEYCDGGDLDAKLREYKKLNEFVEEEQAIKWLKQLLKALQYMHQRRILHRDLKTQNIFVKDNKLKVGDFGISRILMGTADMASTFVGTPYYMSPEVLKHEQYNEKCDIWSLGCVLYEICCFKHAFEGQSLMAVMYKIVSNETPELPDRYSRGLSNIMEKMLARDAEQRHTAKEIIGHLAVISSRAEKTSEGKKKKDLTPKERLLLRKQKEADEKYRKHKELAEQNYKENERRHKEAIEKNFHRTSIESSPKHEDVAGSQQFTWNKESERGERKSNQTGSKTSDPERPHLYKSNIDHQNKRKSLQSKTYSAQLQDSPSNVKISAAVTVPSNLHPNTEDSDDSETEGTLQGTSVNLSFDADSTQELISSLIRNGDIPEDAFLAETLYSQHEDFESDSDSSLEDEPVHLSDTEYREMLGCMEKALDLEETTQAALSVTRKENRSEPMKTNAPPSTFTTNIIDNQIRNLRDRCRGLLGEDTFNHAYAYLRSVWSNPLVPEVSNYASVMQHLSEIVPDKNKCFQLEQLIYLENNKAM